MSLDYDRFEKWREGYQTFVPDAFDYEIIQIYYGREVFYANMDLTAFVMDITIFTVDAIIYNLLGD